MSLRQGMTASVDYRCKTCNHKDTKHGQYGIEKLSGYCMKKDCDCQGYKTTTAEKTNNLGSIILVFLVITGIGLGVSSCNDAIGKHSPDDGQCIMQSTRGPEPC